MSEKREIPMSKKKIVQKMRERNSWSCEVS